MKSRPTVSIADLLPDWLHAPILPIGVGNEARVLGPAFLLAVALVAIGRLLGEGLGRHLTVVGFGFGCTALGAVAAGRDFVHRTAGSILSLPCSRSRLWWMRMSVALVGMIALAAVVAALNWQSLPDVPEHAFAYGMVLVTPIFGGLFVAPWLTLLCRSPLAGSVFAVTLPFGLWSMSELAALVRFGPEYGSSPEMDLFRAGVAGLMLLAHWVVGAYFGWRQFTRLEVVEGPVGELHLPRWLSRRRPAASVANSLGPANPVGQLLKKEARLQQMAYLATGLFLLVWLSAWWVHRLRPELRSDFIDVGTLLYAGLLSILIGAVASAEERQLGTAEWQMLLPMAAWRQWMVKAVTVLGLAILLAGLLPASALCLLSWGNEFKDGWSWSVAWFCVVAMALATASLYVSSTCSTGLKAMLISLPVGAELLAFLGMFINRYERILRGWSIGETWSWLELSLPPLLLLSLFALALGFASINHRYADRPPGRMWRQVGLLIAGAALSFATTYRLSIRLAFHAPADSARILAPSATAPSTTAVLVPRGMDPDLMRRYGRFPKNATVGIATDLNAPVRVRSPKQAPANSTTSPVPPRRDLELMKRYGLMPRNGPANTATNPASK